MIHLGERECSIQRRHQKVIEECPSPLIARHPAMRARMGEAAVRAARAAGYYNAGTVEFLVDSELNYYFLEMNTRLQVEHPVTELVTGLDLVHWQLRIASGERLTLRQDDITWRGSAIECRIYAEDPDNHFFPSPGLIQSLSRPSGPGIRLDSGVYAGWTVPLEYDPLLAKLAVWSPERDASIGRMLRALDEYYIAGIKTNIGFFRQILCDPEFRAGHLHTGFIDEFFARTAVRPALSGEEEERKAVAALVGAVHASWQKSEAASSNGAPGSLWLAAGRMRQMR
jgi:acetyl-CoA carboxylase biotin carboxylase subunit